MKVKPVIMAGGSGTRLWPLSRQTYPKQFIKINDDLSSFQKTILRNKGLGKPTIIIGESHRFIALTQIREIDIEVDFIIEPFQKNTAPCAVIASLVAQQNNSAIVLLLSADHYIADEGKYLAAITKSFNALDQYGIATIGITPGSANISYGYIKTKKLIDDQVWEAEKFKEKPDLATIQDYLQEGNYFWNSGIFIYHTEFMLKTAEKIQNSLFKYVHSSFANSRNEANFTRLAKEEYSLIQDISVDYAIMEYLPNMLVIEGDFGWNDLGNWDTIWQLATKDSNNNYLEGDIYIEEVKNSYISSNKKLTTVVGINNIVIVNTEDALLVADKTQGENVKKLVEQLAIAKRNEIKEHSTIIRPWGIYQIIDVGEFHKVKRIIVYPGEELSLQYHHHRAEHWVIIKGQAEVIIGDQTRKLVENETVSIPQGMLHKLTNIGNIDLYLVEIQTGTYLNEDDIVRVKDIYNRS